MRTLIRASQLHPDVSGLVINYTSGIYPAFSNISGVSGISTIKSGSYLFITLDENENVSKINNLTGSLFLTGESGVYLKLNGQNITIGYSGGAGAGTVKNISGYGNIDVWPANDSTFIISGISITGTNGIETYYNPYKTLLTVKGAGIGTLNNITGNINLIGNNGTNITTSGQFIYINTAQAASSGVNSINTLRNGGVSLIAGTDIDINTVTGSKTIIVSYSGNGWGNSNVNLGTNSDTNYIGNDNIFQDTTESFILGNSNHIDSGSAVYILGSQNSRYNLAANSTFINTTGSYLGSLTGSTVINGIINNSVLKHPYSFSVGGSVDNTFTNNFSMKAFLSGKEIMKPFVVPKTKYSGIYMSTGSILFGEINYVAVRYDVTNFEASFDAKDFGIYGKKNFMAQRATNLQVQVRDESDLFGGIDKYGIFLSGGNDENLYLWASGYSGNDPGDGLDGVHDVIFIANLNFVNFGISPYL